jgi:hypothetical protein
MAFERASILAEPDRLERLGRVQRHAAADLKREEGYQRRLEMMRANRARMLYEVLQFSRYKKPMILPWQTTPIPVIEYLAARANSIIRPSAVIRSLMPIGLQLRLGMSGEELDLQYIE